MNAVILFNIVIIGIVLLACIAFAVNSLLTRFSPGYAIKRRHKRADTLERWRIKQARKDEARDLRELNWSLNHPGNKRAAAFLDNYQEVDDTPADPVPVDPGLRLIREKQTRDDHIKKVGDRIDEENRMMFEWALANPSSPEGRRHLREMQQGYEREVSLSFNDEGKKDAQNKLQRIEAALSQGSSLTS